MTFSSCGWVVTTLFLYHSGCSIVINWWNQMRHLWFNQLFLCVEIWSVKMQFICTVLELQSSPNEFFFEKSFSLLFFDERTILISKQRLKRKDKENGTERNKKIILNKRVCNSHAFQFYRFIGFENEKETKIKPALTFT